jgi:hypothetical protein
VLEPFRDSANDDRASAHCTAQVLHSEELPYGPLGFWLVKADVKITSSSRGQAFVSTLFDYVPRQMSFQRSDTFWLNCERLKTHNCASLIWCGEVISYKPLTCRIAIVSGRFELAWFANQS